MWVVLGGARNLGGARTQKHTCPFEVDWMYPSDLFVVVVIISYNYNQQYSKTVYKPSHS